MRLLVIDNPSAGRGRAGRHIAAAVAYLRERGGDVDLQTSRSAAELTQLAAAGSTAGYDRVVICGGDGSINLAVREFDLERGTLGIIPLGSGNDFAKVLALPRRLRDACDVLLGGAVREVDVALANGLRYVGVAGLGFDSEVAAFANASKSLLRGSLVYLYSILRVLPRFAPRHVLLNGKSEVIMFAVVGNSRQYGGGIRITPDAKIDDGLLDLCVVHRTSRFQLLKTLPAAYRGAHVKNTFVELGRATHYHFDSEVALEVYADGERITATPVMFELASQKLRVAVP